MCIRSKLYNIKYLNYTNIVVFILDIGCCDHSTSWGLPNYDCPEQWQSFLLWNWRAYYGSPNTTTRIYKIKQFPFFILWTFWNLLRIRFFGQNYFQTGFIRIQLTFTVPIPKSSACVYEFDEFGVIICLIDVAYMRMLFWGDAEEHFRGKVASLILIISM